MIKLDPSCLTMFFSTSLESDRLKKLMEAFFNEVFKYLKNNKVYTRKIAIGLLLDLKSILKENKDEMDFFKSKPETLGIAKIIKLPVDLWDDFIQERSGDIRKLVKDISEATSDLDEKLLALLCLQEYGDTNIAISNDLVQKVTEQAFKVFKNKEGSKDIIEQKSYVVQKMLEYSIPRQNTNQILNNNLANFGSKNNVICTVICKLTQTEEPWFRPSVIYDANEKGKISIQAATSFLYGVFLIKVAPFCKNMKINRNQILEDIIWHSKPKENHFDLSCGAQEESFENKKLKELLQYILNRYSGKPWSGYEAYAKIFALIFLRDFLQENTNNENSRELKRLITDRNNIRERLLWLVQSDGSFFPEGRGKGLYENASTYNNPLAGLSLLNLVDSCFGKPVGQVGLF